MTHLQRYPRANHMCNTTDTTTTDQAGPSSEPERKRQTKSQWRARRHAARAATRQARLDRLAITGPPAFAVVMADGHLGERFQTEEELARWLADYDHRPSYVEIDPVEDGYRSTRLIRHRAHGTLKVWDGPQVEPDVDEEAIERKVYTAWLYDLEIYKMIYKMVGDNTSVYFSRADLLEGIDPDDDQEWFNALCDIADSLGWTENA